MKNNTFLLGNIQFLKTIQTLQWGAFYKLLLVDVPNAGPWNCVSLQNVCVIGPYSPQWYSFYHLFSLIGYTLEMASFCAIDTFLVLRIGQVEKLSYSLVVALAGFFFLFYDPGDLLIYWLALLSRGHWFLSITAITTKLPIFAPLNVWKYVWTISLPTVNPTIPLNPIRYTILLGFLLQPIWNKLVNHARKA